MSDAEVEVQPGSTVRSSDRHRDARKWSARLVAVVLFAGGLLVWANSGDADEGRRVDVAPDPPPSPFVHQETSTPSRAEATTVSFSESAEVVATESPLSPVTTGTSTQATSTQGGTSTASTTTTSTTLAATTTAPPRELIDVGFAAPDASVVDAMLGSDSAQATVNRELNLAAGTPWIANTRVARVWVYSSPWFWQVGDAGALASDRSAGWQERLATKIATSLVNQNFLPFSTPPQLDAPTFHSETGFADVRLGGAGQVAVGPDALVYVLTPGEWATPPPARIPVPPFLADQWRLADVTAAGFVPADDWWFSTSWNLVGLGANDLTATFTAPLSVDQARAMQMLCGAAPISTTTETLPSGDSYTIRECDNDGYFWSLGTADPEGTTRVSRELVLTLAHGGDTWPYVGATGP